MANSTLSQRLRSNLYIGAYLAELSSILGRPVAKDELESMDATQAVADAQKPLLAFEPVKFEIPFSQRSAKPVHDLIQTLSFANPAPLFLWASHANDCGVLKLRSLADVRSDFAFDVNEGLISLVTIDLCDQILLDFYEEEGSQVLCLAVQGTHWTAVARNRSLEI